MAERRYLTLYTGPGCHLCDQAKTLIYAAMAECAFSLKEVDISGDDQLKQNYGLRIPVVLADTGEEKGWPFTVGQIKRMMQ
ncbi:MAG: glutaredoxin family protein [bacterium]